MHTILHPASTVEAYETQTVKDKKWRDSIRYENACDSIVGFTRNHNSSISLSLPLAGAFLPFQLLPSEFARRHSLMHKTTFDYTLHLREQYTEPCSRPGLRAVPMRVYVF